MFVCETPGIWGKLPDGFAHLWDANPKMLLSTSSALKKSADGNYTLDTRELLLLLMLLLLFQYYFILL